jgi:xylulose-5-phosphate/fructose-6-phosphate phosphoketolase
MAANMGGFTMNRTFPREINQPLSPETLPKIDAYWRAANYLSVGQIYLLDNPLLKEPMQAKHIKPRLLGHWGTTPGPTHPRLPELFAGP